MTKYHHNGDILSSVKITIAVVARCSNMVCFYIVKNRIKELRQKKLWSQAELAARCETSTQQIQRLEAGTRRLSDFWMEKLAAAFEIPAWQLIEDPAAVLNGPVEKKQGADFEDQAQQGYRAAPEGLDPLDAEIMELVKKLDQREKLMLSGTLKSLPRAENPKPAARKKIPKK